MLSQRRAGVVLGYANIIAKNLINLAYTPMLLSFVGQADYGVYQTSYSFVFSLTLLSFGFSQAYVRFYTERRVHGTEKDICRLNGVYLVLYLAVSVVAFVLGLVFAANAEAIFSVGFTSDEVDLAKTVMSIMAGSIAVTLLNSVFDAYMLAHEEFRFQQTRQIATTVVTPFAAYGLLLLGMGVIGVAIAQLVINVVLLGLNASFCIGRLGMRFDVRRFDTALFRSIAAFSAWIFANQVCDLVNQNVPNVLLGALTSATAVAVFAISVQIRNVFVSLSSTISSVFTPKINRIVAESDDNTELTLLMARAGRYQMLLFCWVYGGFALLGRFFVKCWAGLGFMDAYWLVLVMTLPLAVPLVQNTGIEIQRAKNRHRARSLVMFVMAVFNVIFTIITSPSMGYWAPAIAYATSILLGNGVFMNWYYQRRIGLDMKLFWRTCLPIVAVGVAALVVCFAGTLIVPVSGWVAFFIWGVAYTMIFMVLAWLFVMTDDEKVRARSRILRKERG